MTKVELATVVRWAAETTRPGRPTRPFSGEYDIVLKDVGATIGVGVYWGETLVHAFYAHTRYESRAAETARELVARAIESIVANEGAMAVMYKFPHVFPGVVAAAGHRPLNSELLTGGSDDDHDEEY